MRYIFLIVGVSLTLLGCQNTSQKDTGTHLKPRFNYVQQIPDSLRTPRQKKLVRQLLKLSMKHVKAINNRMVFTMSKDEFKETGIPIKYYSLFKNSMEEANKYIEENNIQNVDKMVKKYHQNTRRVLKEKYQ